MKVSGTQIVPVGPTFKATASKSVIAPVWSPGQTHRQEKTKANCVEIKETCEVNPVWQPFGNCIETPQFRAVKVEMIPKQEIESKILEPEDCLQSNKLIDKNIENVEVQEQKNKLQGIHENSAFTAEDPFCRKSPLPMPLMDASSGKIGANINLPLSQSPTIILLQKAREGRFPRGAVYIDSEKTSDANEKKTLYREESYDLKTSELAPTTDVKAFKYDGIGPTEYGIPTGLRTSVKDEHASDWYRTMYRSLHRQPLRKGEVIDCSGYMSEPEFSRDSSFIHKSKHDMSNSQGKMKSRQEVQYVSKESKSSESDSSNPFLHLSSNSSCDTYKNQPRSIADYEPGHSSIADKEFKKFWGDFWDSFGDLKQNLGGDLKENNTLGRRRLNYDGYDSDSTIIRKTGEMHRLDPVLQKVLYKKVQKGGEIPFTGLGKLAPEKPQTSSHQYSETEVNIHYKSPIRNLEKEFIDEEELRRRQEITMKRFYEEEKSKKWLQHQAEIEMRRHCDNFMPAEKSPISLNRYDNPFTTRGSSSNKTPEPQTIARGLYSFSAHNTRELSFHKGDIIYIHKKIDKNWYEGEHHGEIGIFPVNYVEIIPFEDANLQPRKATEGQALVKFNFRAQTPLELSLFKGEIVILIRKVDDNWFEGRIGTKRGIFPSAYVEVKATPMEVPVCHHASPKDVVSPLYETYNNQHIYSMKPTNSVVSKEVISFTSPTDVSKLDENIPVTQSLCIDTYNEPIPYRALYGYSPQNDDELELWEGDTIYVMEKCDDGWYVGTSLRSGLFGTFPGNYVERIWYDLNSFCHKWRII